MSSSCPLNKFTHYIIIFPTGNKVNRSPSNLQKIFINITPAFLKKSGRLGFLIIQRLQLSLRGEYQLLRRKLLREHLPLPQRELHQLRELPHPE